MINKYITGYNSGEWRLTLTEHCDLHTTAKSQSFNKSQLLFAFPPPLPLYPTTISLSPNAGWKKKKKTQNNKRQNSETLLICCPEALTVLTEQYFIPLVSWKMSETSPQYIKSSRTGKLCHRDPQTPFFKTLFQDVPAFRLVLGTDLIFCPLGKSHSQNQIRKADVGSLH